MVLLQESAWQSWCGFSGEEDATRENVCVCPWVAHLEEVGTTMQKGLRVRKLGTPATGSRMYDKDIQEPRGINVRRQGGATEEGGLPLLLASFSLLLSTSSTFSPAVTHLSPLCCLMSFFPPFFLSSPFLSFTHTSSHRSSLCSLMFFFPSSFFSYCLPSQPTAGHHSPLCSAA